jgi:GntR family transcriptional regulator
MKNLPIVELDQIAAMHASPYKLYHSLGQIIRSKIQSGEWLVSKQIPSERMLMQAFSVSRATVRQAVENLVKEGILYREQGKGTFVSPPKIQQGVLRLLDFVMIMRRNGLAPSVCLLGKDIFVPPLDIRTRLALPENSKTIYVQRLLLANDSPMIIESSHLPAEYFPGLLEGYDGQEEILSFVSQRYGIRVSQVSEVFEPVILESHEANLLGVKLGFPALWVDYTALDPSHKPLACITTLLRGDRCRFYADLTFD